MLTRLQKNTLKTDRNGLLEASFVVDIDHDNDADVDANINVDVVREVSRRLAYTFFYSFTNTLIQKKIIGDGY